MCEGEQTDQANPRPMTTFLLVDDHPVIGFALRHLIEREHAWAVSAVATSLEEAARRINERPPHAVVLDLIFPEDSGLSFLHWLSKEHPAIVSIVYSLQPSGVYARRCLAAGAAGYASKQAPTAVLVETIAMAVRGQTAIDGRPPLPPNDPDAPTPLAALSARELEVFELLGQGLSNTRVAAALCRSVKTIESHRYRISRKLGVTNGPELVHLAMQHRVADDADRRARSRAC